MNNTFKEPIIPLPELRHGKSYYMEIKHIISVRNKYKLNISRDLINKKYDITRYMKST